MVKSLYDEYLYVLGMVKDVHKLDMEVDHKDIHTFYKDKRPLFKLIYGHFQEEEHPSIVVSFHLDLFHSEAIQWFVQLYNIHPLLRLHDSWLEDDRGEFFLGADALALKNIKNQQEILAEWLDNYTADEIKQFVDAPVYGRERDIKKSFNSQAEKDQAIMEFNRIRGPEEDEGVH